MDLENQPGLRISFNGQGPSIWMLYVMLRPKILSSMAVDEIARIKRVPLLKKFQKTDNLSLTSRTLWSTSVDAKEPPIVTASTRRSTIVQTALSGANCQDQCIPPPLSEARTVETAKLDDLKMERLSRMENPTQCALARPSTTGKQLSVTTPQELTRLVLVRAVAAADPASYALGLRSKGIFPLIWCIAVCSP